MNRPKLTNSIKKHCLLWISHQSIARILFIILFLESLAISLAIWGAIAVGYSPKAFFEEGGYMTILSCLQLLSAGMLSRKIFLTIKNSPKFILTNNGLFWQVTSWGLFYLTLDDAFQIHEHIDKLGHLIVNILFNFEETYLSDLADDLIVGGYLLLFLAYAAKEWQTIQIFQRAFVYFQIGFVLTVVMITFDAASNNTLFVSLLTDDPDRKALLQVWFGTFEDSVKIYAEGLFIVGIYKCWRIVKSLSSQP